ncbi:MAG: quinolinate synthase NadA [Lentisphaeria bacterium]|nr:quinolinate synthase NadA [Lentisphaeria bacterium]
MDSILQEIAELKARHHAVIMAHNYTLGEIQDIADYTGDSLELSRKAAESKAPVIVFCGVRFMAETAKILSPDSIVLHPEPEAGCPMADMADPSEVAAYKLANPDTLLIAYVNTTAATKKEVDLCCTSGNAEKIISKLPENQKIMFLPDSNLGRNVSEILNRPMNFWGGCCPIHDRITVADIERARKAHPGAVVLVHPECRPEVVAAADQALSTGGMLKFVQESAAAEFIVGTECGIMHRMSKENPGKNFYALEPVPVCVDMKKITLEKVRNALRDLSPQVELDAETIAKAAAPIAKMLEIS